MGPAVHETTDEFWNHLMNLNAGSVLNVVRAAVPGMLAAGYGKIVNIGAMGGVTGKGNMGAYSASKSVVIRLTESLSAELREHGINVIACCPASSTVRPIAPTCPMPIQPLGGSARPGRGDPVPGLR